MDDYERGKAVEGWKHQRILGVAMVLASLLLLISDGLREGFINVIMQHWTMFLIFGGGGLFFIWNAQKRLNELR